MVYLREFVQCALHINQRVEDIVEAIHRAGLRVGVLFNIYPFEQVDKIR